MAVVLVVALAVANVITYSSLRSFLYGRLDDQIDGAQLQAYHFLTVQLPRIEAHRPHVGNQFVKTELDARVSPDIYLLVILRSGAVISVASGPPNTPDPRPLVPASLRPEPFPRSHRYGALGGAYHSEPNRADVGSVGSSGVRYRESAVDVPQGVLIVAESLDSTTDTLSSLLRVQLIASLAVLAVLVAVVLYTLRRGLRPLETMAETTDAIAGGDLTRRVAVGSASSEVDRLGYALNDMLGRIEVAFREKSSSEARLRQFVADASHELRTPLTSIRGYTELLRKGAFTDDESRDKALQRVEREAGRMGLLVSDLLLLARLDQDRPIELVPVDLSKVAADAVGDARAVDPDRRIELVVQGPVIVLGDRDRLGQVAHNLVRNALEHTPSGTSVTVSVRADTKVGTMTVTDQGPGLSPEAASRVFDRFWRDDAARTGGGSGLGLSIVRAIAEVLGGSASVRSTPGQGASFEVAIPLATGPLTTLPAAKPQPAERVAT
jgi:two-component system, OmpR family, sensor kinase